MEYLLLFISVFASSTKTVLSKICNKKTVHLFNAGVFFAGFLVLLLFGIGNTLTISGYAVITALFYATFTLIAQMFTYRAVRLGDVGVTSLIYYCGFIIPTVFSVAVWKESFGVMKAIGFFFILCSFALGTKKSGDKEQSGGFRWLIAAFTAMLGSGLVGITQKIFAKSSHSAELNGMLLLAFSIIIVFSFVMHLIFERQSIVKQSETEVSTPISQKQPNKKSWIQILSAILVGVAMATANKINSYLPGIMDGVVFFPVVNGGSIVMGMIGGILLFHEKATIRKVSAILIGVLAIVLTVL
ncbi:MAG: EamA family transporter [Clostridia bacterium]|nr:EamA family transporter [Clostridia bacterium]